MPYQSTKNKYRTRKEKNQEAFRRYKIIALFAVLLGIFWILKDWEDHWAYYKTYFMAD